MHPTIMVRQVIRKSRGKNSAVTGKCPNRTPTPAGKKESRPWRRSSGGQARRSPWPSRPGRRSPCPPCNCTPPPTTIDVQIHIYLYIYTPIQWKGCGGKGNGHKNKTKKQGKSGEVVGRWETQWEGVGRWVKDWRRNGSWLLWGCVEEIKLAKDTRNAKDI